MTDWEPKIRKAIRHFWTTRHRQSASKTADGRTAATGGRQLDGFLQLLRTAILQVGIPAEAIFLDRQLELPGYFRPEKKWDLLVVSDERLLAAIEVKSHVGPSFGNNFNNRSEEAIGSAQDIWTAYREGAFALSDRPWLGYLMLLEDERRATRPVSVREPHFSVFPEFRDASYSERYSLLLTRLLRERLYDSAALLLSPAKAARTGAFSTPKEDLSFEMFVESFTRHLCSVG